jgi:ribosome biogenesis GTPase A
MYELHDYQEEIKGYYSRLSKLFEPYGQDENGQGLARVLEKHRVKVASPGSEPRVILYGGYNSGKSTLLNALMREEKAEVGDVPTTHKITSYHWHGYEMIDSPGIGAPEQDEKVSNEKLDDCHAIVFVLSQNYLDNKETYERMQYVIKKKKKLLITWNDKEGFDPSLPKGQEAIQEIKEKILKNLSKVTGIENEKIVHFYKVVFVNGQEALEGRIRNETSLEQSSNIEELETEILKQIKQVKGFDISYGILKNLIDDVAPEVEKLFFDSCENETVGMKSGLRDLSREYWDFLKAEQANIERQCAGFSRDMLALFPKDPFSEQKTDEGTLRAGITQLQKRYQAKVSEDVQDNLKRFYDDVVSRIDTTIEGLKAKAVENAQAGVALPDFSVPFVDVKTAAPYEGADAAQNIDALKDIMIASTPFLEKLPAVIKIPPIPFLPPIPPIPLPFPPIVIIQTVLAGLKLAEKIFGDSESEKRKRQVEAEAAAMQEAEKRRERARVNWRQDIKDHCDRSAEGFVDNLKRVIKKYLKDALDPLLDNAKEIVGLRDESRKTLENVKGEYYAIKSEIETTLEELQAP